MIKIKIKTLYPNVVLPIKVSKEAACYDVVVRELIQNNPNKVTIKLGFATEIPLGYKGVIVPRSSFTQKGWIMQNSPGQIDSDYRGEWMIKFEGIPMKEPSAWLNSEPEEGAPVLVETEFKSFPYKVGDRCAQIFFEKVENVYWEEVNELKSTDRDKGGFGSTGK